MDAVSRALLPTDLLALVARGSGWSDENQAWPRERLGAQEPQPALKVLRDQMLVFGKQRKAFVSVKRQKLHALVGARHRGGRQAWEVDYLIDCGAGEAVMGALLAQAVQAAGESRAEKLFMRLERESELLTPAREAGFMPYQEEVLYGLNEPLNALPAECRPASPADSYPLFRLYTASTPEPIRRHEAVTYAEWQAGMERRWAHNGVHLVQERNGAIRAAVRASRLPQGLMFELTLTAEAVGDAIGLIASAREAIDATNANEPMLVLVPSTEEGVVRRMEDAGFRVVGEFVSLVHRTTRPLSLPKAVPAVAKNVVGV